MTTGAQFDLGAIFFNVRRDKIAKDCHYLQYNLKISYPNMSYKTVRE